MRKLLGLTIIRNNEKFDYCVKEAIMSMIPICNHVLCVYVESDDNTLGVLKGIESDNLTILELPESEWQIVQGKERLSYITNIGMQWADKNSYEYVLYVQADECIAEYSHDAIWKAINEGHEGYLMNRINLWKNCDLQLNVSQERKPCSTEVIRLTKSCYRAYDDAENINSQCKYIIDDAFIFHYGFVRKKEVMKGKIINMQEGVFGMSSHDSKLDSCEVFNPDLWFDAEKDLIPLTLPHPKVMSEWVKTRP